MQQSVNAVLDYSHSELGTTQSLIRFSALNGFPHMMVEHMRALVKKLKIVVKRVPTTEKGLFSLILRELFPAITQERIDILFALRGKKKKIAEEEKAKANLTHNFENAEEVLAPDDLLEIQEMVVEARKRHEASERPPAPSRAGRVTASRGDEIDLDVARQFKPPLTSMTKDTKLQWRWIGNFRGRKVYPKTVTKSWTLEEGGVSEREALIFVLTTLWEWCHEDTGEINPHDFNLVFESPILSSGAGETRR